MGRTKPPPSEASRAASRADQQRRALEQFRLSRGMNYAEMARTAKLPNANSFYNFLAGRTHSLATTTLERLRDNIPGATLSEILGETPSPSAQVRILPVRAEAKAGGWRERYDLPDNEQILIPVPAPPSVMVDEVVRLADNHAEDVYPRGALLFVEQIDRMRRPLRGGDRVIVRRIRDGRGETTVREVSAPDEQEHGAHLTFQSHAPEFQARVMLPWPYDGRFYVVDGDRYQVRARVVMTTALERLDEVA